MRKIKWWIAPHYKVTAVDDRTAGAGSSEISPEKIFTDKVTHIDLSH
jgi:hypothetical protein